MSIEALICHNKNQQTTAILSCSIIIGKTILYYVILRMSYINPKGKERKSI